MLTLDLQRPNLDRVLLVSRHMLTETLAAVRVTAAASDKNYRMEVFASSRFDFFFPGIFECAITSFSCYRINWKLTTWTPSIFPPVLDYLPSLFPLLFAVRHLLSRFLLCRLSAFGCCGLEMSNTCIFRLGFLSASRVCDFTPPPSPVASIDRRVVLRWITLRRTPPLDRTDGTATHFASE